MARMRLSAHVINRGGDVKPFAHSRTVIVTWQTAKASAEKSGTCAATGFDAPLSHVAG
jgi:hypothetical protein